MPTGGVKIDETRIFTYSIHSPNPLNLMDQKYGDLHRRVFRASLVLAREIGAAVIVYHAGRYRSEEAYAGPGYLLPEEAEQNHWRDRKADHLRELAEV